jgi:MFS family permease
MTNISLAAFGGFLAVIVKSFGYSALETQLLTVPVFVFAGISTLVVGNLSDKTRKRGIYLIACYTTAAVGWLMLIAGSSRGVLYTGAFLAGGGTYPTVILIQSWQNSTVIGYTKRSVNACVLNLNADNR